MKYKPGHHHIIGSLTFQLKNLQNPNYEVFNLM